MCACSSIIRLVDFFCPSPSPPTPSVTEPAVAVAVEDELLEVEVEDEVIDHGAKRCFSAETSV